MGKSHRTEARAGSNAEHTKIVEQCASGELAGFARAAAIRHLLKRRGRTLSELSLEASLNRNAASNTLRSPWPRVERIIAEALGTKPQRLFPERYGKDGLPLNGGLEEARRAPTRRAS